MGKVYLYDVNKKLNQHPNDHATMKGKDVVEFHKNAFDGKGHGTEVLVTGKYQADSLDKAILAINAKYWTNRGIKVRDDLYNVDMFRRLGIGYRLVEIDFIDNIDDEAIYDKSFEQYCQELANLFVNHNKDIMLVAGHGEVDVGAVGVNGRKEADAVRAVVKRIYEIANNLSPSTQKPNQPTSNGFNIGDTVEITYPNGAYIADDVALKFGVYQIKETAIAGNDFDWEDNGVPESFVDLVDAKGNKRSDSDKVHAKKGDYFVYNRKFKVALLATDNGNEYLKLDGDGNKNHQFWAVASRCKKI